jgi:hypothetical protein
LRVTLPPHQPFRSSPSGDLLFSAVTIFIPDGRLRWSADVVGSVAHSGARPPPTPRGRYLPNPVSAADTPSGPEPAMSSTGCCVPVATSLGSIPTSAHRASSPWRCYLDEDLAQLRRALERAADQRALADSAGSNGARSLVRGVEDCVQPAPSVVWVSKGSSSQSVVDMLASLGARSPGPHRGRARPSTLTPCCVGIGASLPSR